MEFNQFSPNLKEKKIENPKRKRIHLFPYPSLLFHPTNPRNIPLIFLRIAPTGSLFNSLLGMWRIKMQKWCTNKLFIYSLYCQITTVTLHKWKVTVALHSIKKLYPAISFILSFFLLFSIDRLSPFPFLFSFSFLQPSLLSPLLKLSMEELQCDMDLAGEELTTWVSQWRGRRHGFCGGGANDVDLLVEGLTVWFGWFRSGLMGFGCLLFVFDFGWF